MPNISLGLAPTSQDLELRKQMALLRQLEAQQAQEELKTKLANPVEKAKLDAEQRQFETRTGIGKFSPVNGIYTNSADQGPPPVPADPQVRADEASMPRMVKGLTRNSNTAFTDPDAAMGARERSAIDPRVMAANVSGNADIEAARIAGASRERVAQTAKGKDGDGTPSDYTVERADRTVQSVDELAQKVSPWTTGAGSLLSYLPATDARNFDAELNTLKSNIMMNELTQMREASKTGGALGQVSDTEGKLLQAALGALDSKQSPANFSAQLQKIRESITKWQKAKGLAVSQPSGSRGHRTPNGFLVEDAP